MDSAWTWLKKANARAVCACATVALVIVAGWWTWRVLSPVTVAVATPPPPKPEPVAPGMSLREILARERATFTNQTARNPFLLPEGVRPPVEPVVKVPIRAPVTAVTPTVQPPPATPPPKPPKREVLTLKYRGSMTRGDGTLTALIEDSRSRRTAFYPVGTNVFGLRIESIDAEQLAIVQGQTRTLLRRGAAVSFGEDKHGD